MKSYWVLGSIPGGNKIRNQGFTEHSDFKPLKDKITQWF